MKRFLDATLGKWTRHFLFVFVRSYYALFYNISASGHGFDPLCTTTNTTTRSSGSR